MAGADEFAAVFQRMIDQPAASLEALRADALAFEQSVFAEADGHHAARAAIPQRGSLSFLLYDSRGRPVALEAPALAAAICQLRYDDRASRHAQQRRSADLPPRR